MRIFFDTDLRGNIPRPFKRGKKGIYCIRQRIAGRDVWRSLRTSDRREAEYLAMEIWRHQQSATVKAIVPAAPMKLEALLDRHKETEKFQLLAESTKKTREFAFLAFVEYCHSNGVRYANEVSTTIVERYLSAKASNKNHTWNNRLTDLSAVFSSNAEMKNPCDKIERKSVKRGEKASTPYPELTRRQIAEMLWAIRRSSMSGKREWFDACIVALNTGARYKDIALLKFSDIHNDRAGEYIAFTPAKTAAKTDGKMVLIRPTPKLSALLNRRRRIVDGEFVFPYLARTAYRSTTNLTRVWMDHGVKGSFHSFRVTVITAAARAGINLADFGGVVGHTSESQTKAYNRAALDIDLSALQTHLRSE